MYQVKFYADRRSKGYVINPYLNKEVANAIADTYEKDWEGKYGMQIDSQFINSADTSYVRLDSDTKYPDVPFGISFKVDFV